MLRNALLESSGRPRFSMSGLTIEIEHEDLASTLLSDPPTEVVVTPLSSLEDKGFAPTDHFAVTHLVIEWPASIAQGVLVSWLYDRLKAFAGGIRIDGERVETEDLRLHEQITRLVTSKTK
jgi:hypothetical protein